MADQDWRLTRLREISTNATTSTDVGAIFYMMLRHSSIGATEIPFKLNEQLREFDGSANLVMRVKEIGQELKTTLLESDLEDESFVKNQIDLALDELQQMIDGIFDDGGLARITRTVDYDITIVGPAIPILATVSAPVAAAVAVAVGIFAIFS
ncbi:Oidioi.mRNA.OKI2018_I69.PAR.g12952.t1.cds [Oikopleura dioica]|uniref:Oidioi.mRNA.OKI2018_I69.PAR.g12952.t1.cds n=1 Tax=Oikopleura dioica TaxID=34765 RepID=A0ABN7SAC3_OIKDI|nr:Oidioi.mRNA.OKI2018_I69.PAR.g12952.t1.cds [Oikopleura dioica]